MRCVRDDHRLTRDPDGTVYIGTDGSGVFKTSQTYNIANHSIVERSASLNPQLATAYPNPVSTRGTFTFELAKPSQVRVELVNVLGVRVRLLVDGLYASGSHELSFGTEDLPNGVYSLVINSEGRTTKTNVIVAK